MLITSTYRCVLLFLVYVLINALLLLCKVFKCRKHCSRVSTQKCFILGFFFKYIKVLGKTISTLFAAYHTKRVSTKCKKKDNKK